MKYKLTLGNGLIFFVLLVFSMVSMTIYGDIFNWLYVYGIMGLIYASTIFSTFYLERAIVDTVLNGPVGQTTIQEVNKEPDKISTELDTQLEEQQKIAQYIMKKYNEGFDINNVVAILGKTFDPNLVISIANELIKSKKIATIPEPPAPEEVDVPPEKPKVEPKAEVKEEETPGVEMICPLCDKVCKSSTEFKKHYTRKHK